MVLDVPTLVLLMTVIAFVKSALLLAVGWRRHQELMIWGAGLACLGLGYAFTAVRPHLPYLLGLLVSNVPVGVATALMVEGLRHFLRLDEATTRQWTWGLVVLMVILFLALHDSLDGRVVLVAGVLTAHLGWCWVALNRPIARDYTLGRRLMKVGIALVLLPVWWRAWAALSHQLPSHGFEIPNLYLGIMIGSHLVAIVLISTGALTLIQQRTRLQLASSEGQFRQLLDAANEVMCVLEDGVVRYINPYVEQVTGYHPDELVGQPFIRYVADPDQPLAQLKHALRLQGDTHIEPYELRLVTKTQGTRYFEIRGVDIEWHDCPATLIVLQDVTQRRQWHAEMSELAFHDTLTHLANRHLLMDRLRLALASNLRYQQHGALLFLDLDNFKPLNDTHGHAMGDLLLCVVAQRLQQQVRGVDTVARFGGDEFVVLLTALDPDPDTAREDATELAERVRAALAQPYRLRPAGAPDGEPLIEHHCTASVGVVLFGRDAPSPDAVVQQADAAMYQAKHEGRNRVVVV